VLYRLAPTRHVFLLVMHHIVGDGWSMNVLYRELLAMHAAHRTGAPSPLPALPLQYKDFAVWQNRQDFSADERFWVTALDGAPDRVSLPYDHAPEGGRDFAGRIAQLRVSRSTTDRLRGLASAHETTLSTIVLTLFFLFLYQWTRQDDLCVGVSVANRNHPAIERLIGFFVNILPVRVRLSDQLELAELIQTVRDQSTAAFEHQDYPFDLLVRRLKPTRVANRQPILNVIYAYQNFEDVTIDLGVRAAHAPATPSGDPMPVVPARSGSEGIRPFAVPFETAKFDVTLFVTEMDDELELSLEYDTSLFEDRTAQRTLETLQRFADMAE
ncbi:MAG: condensation domain-containing protein, partial [Vicinamibacterales bacterium]|nr:condensation domain-containing protein [Vicinamibacterales bacterium]